MCDSGRYGSGFELANRGERRGPCGSDHHPVDADAARFVEGRLGQDDEAVSPCYSGRNCKRCKASMEKIAGALDTNAIHGS